jgi:pimeloyl-ACP methyl ester carboxylesterase
VQRPLAPGRPTVLLISGYHDAGDAWDISELITPPAIGPPVPQALATGHRVCTFDRPGTVRYTLGSAVLTDRSTPVAQPRTAADVVAELHALLAAADVPGPYVLTAHSLGGLFAHLYARTYPDEVRGIVFVDAISATLSEVFGAKWPPYREVLQAAPPGTPLDRPEAEKIDAASRRSMPPLRCARCRPLCSPRPSRSRPPCHRRRGRPGRRSTGCTSQPKPPWYGYSRTPRRLSPPAVTTTSSGTSPTWSPMHPDSSSTA